MGQAVVQWQIISMDPEKTTSFYTGLFGWDVNTDNALGYRMIDTRSEHGIGGGIWPAPPEGRPTVMLYVEVEDVSAFVERAKENGGGLIIPPQLLPDGDEMAVIHDPEGVAIGLTKRKTSW